MIVSGLSSSKLLSSSSKLMLSRPTPRITISLAQNVTLPKSSSKKEYITLSQ